MAIGFPGVENGFLTLTHSEVQDSSIPAPVTPSLSTWHDLALGGNDGRSHIFDLVSVEGEVVAEVRQATQDEYVLKSDGHLFSAIVRHPGALQPVPLPPMRQIPVGSRIRVTGICILADANPFYGEVPFNILLRDFDDIMVVAKPPWLSVPHLMMIVGLLFGVVIALGLRMVCGKEKPSQDRVPGIRGAPPQQNPGRHQPFQAAGRDSGANHRVGFSAAEWRALLVPGREWIRAG